MDPVPDSFLLALAELSAGLTGLFLVGMIFYIQQGYKSNERSRAVMEPYFRAATAITLIAYAIPMTVSLTLIALPIVWSRVLLLLLVVLLVLTNISTVATVKAVRREVGLPLLTMVEVVGTGVVALMIVFPLASGGLRPDQEDLVPTLLLSLGIAFLGTVALVLTLFDIARYERSELPDPLTRRARTRLRRRRSGAPTDAGTPEAPPSGKRA